MQNWIKPIYLSEKERREKKLKQWLELMLEFLHEGAEDMRQLDYSERSVMNTKLVDFQQRLTTQIVVLELKEDRETSLIKQRQQKNKQVSVLDYGAYPH